MKKYFIVCQLKAVTEKAKFGQTFYELSSTNTRPFNSEDEAEIWVEENGQRDGRYSILKVCQKS